MASKTACGNACFQLPRMATRRIRRTGRTIIAARIKLLRQQMANGSHPGAMVQTLFNGNITENGARDTIAHRHVLLAVKEGEGKVPRVCLAERMQPD
jgi:hypothetical protein